MSEIPAQVEREVLRRARGRCEGWLDDPRMKRAGERCRSRGTDRDPLELIVDFWTAIGGEEIRVCDVTLLCDACYVDSETAAEWAHWDYLLAKDD